MAIKMGWDDGQGLDGEPSLAGDVVEQQGGFGSTVTRDDNGRQTTEPAYNPAGFKIEQLGEP
jgi:hypothetical protein